MNSITLKNIRVQILSEEIIRLELKSSKGFCDQDTFLIPNRNDFKKDVEVKQEENDNEYIIKTNRCAIIIPKNTEGLKGIKVLSLEGEVLYRYKRIKNTGELPLLNKTPKVFPLMDNPRIIVPEAGYSYPGKKEWVGYKVEKRAQDIYLFLCDQDPRKLRKLFIELTGRIELVRLATLGLWNSKYYVYDEASAKQTILDYASHDVPLDNIVLDTDWRKASDRGIGYEVDDKLFPDMSRYFDFAHSHNVEVMFNDHPEPVEGTKTLFSSREVKYREENIKYHLSTGLDTWWYDRNWHTKLKTPVKGVPCETFGLYLFQDITKHYYQEKANNKDVYIRPVIMGNIDNVLNGLYSGISSSASHRFSIQWTGDIPSDYTSLATEIETMIKASNNGIVYVNADCGGHTGNPDKPTYIRWMQFGAFSPVYRPHCTINLPRNREPWVYDEETLNIVREYIKLRYRLLPVIYREAFNSYLNGEPIFKSLGWEYPNDKKAHKIYNQYMLGNGLLLAPVYGNEVFVLEEKDYVEPIKATYFGNRNFEGKPILEKTYKTICQYLNHNSPEKGVPPYDFSTIYETSIKFDDDGYLFVDCDDGVKVIVDGEVKVDDQNLHSIHRHKVMDVEKGRVYKVRLEYFQAGGEAAIALLYEKSSKKEKNKFYLPEGDWLYAFNGKIYKGGRTYQKVFSLEEMPVFIRLGSIIPLARNAQTTTDQKWDKLIYDFYPSKTQLTSGEIYEDDTKTTAYKLGQYRLSKYQTQYDTNENKIIVTLNKAEGLFEGNKCFKQRDILLKYHLLPEVKNVSRIRINGNDVEFKKVSKKKSSFILNESRYSKTEQVIPLRFKQNLSEDVVIEIYLND